jgi:hypothetical protein
VRQKQAKSITNLGESRKSASRMRAVHERDAGTTQLLKSFTLSIGLKKGKKSSFWEFEYSQDRVEDAM